MPPFSSMFLSRASFSIKVSTTSPGNSLGVRSRNGFRRSRDALPQYGLLEFFLCEIEVLEVRETRPGPAFRTGGRGDFASLLAAEPTIGVFERRRERDARPDENLRDGASRLVHAGGGRGLHDEKLSSVRNAFVVDVFRKFARCRIARRAQ